MPSITNNVLDDLLDVAPSLAAGSIADKRQELLRRQNGGTYTGSAMDMTKQYLESQSAFGSVSDGCKSLGSPYPPDLFFGQLP